MMLLLNLQRLGQSSQKKRLRKANSLRRLPLNNKPQLRKLKLKSNASSKNNFVRSERRKKRPSSSRLKVESKSLCL